MLVLADGDDRPDEFVTRMRAAGVATDVLSMRSDVSLALLRRLVRTIRARQCDIVHTHLLHADLYGALAARLAGVRTIISTRHNPDPFRRSWPIQFLTRSARPAWTHVICISEHLREFCQTNERIPAQRLSTVHYGFAPRVIANGRAWRRQFGWNEEVPVIGMVARLIPQKGHDVLLDALPAVLRHSPTAQLVLIGDGPLRLALEAQAVRLGIKDHVQFLGYREDSAAWMAGFEIFVHPSRWEGFGLVLLEAMNASLPIVATTAGAIPEIVRHGETGLLVPPDQPAELAAALCTLLRDQPRATAMGTAGRRRLEDTFSVTDMVEQTCAVYRRCLERKGDYKERASEGLCPTDPS
jgi:glycosyltransferase involved in cell wall biosynthesis